MNDPIIASITDFIFVSHEIVPSDIIFVPGGVFASLAERAAELYRQGMAPVVMPASAIMCEDESMHTRDNAFFSRRLCDSLSIKVKRGIICCMSFHARRCQMLYKMAFPEAEILISPVDCYGITRETWYRSEYGVERVTGELMRCGSQFVDDIKNYLGL